MSVLSWARRNVGSSSDYRPANSMVNKLRRDGLGGSAAGAGIGAAVGGTGGFLWGLSNLANDRVEVVNTTYQVTRPVLVGADFDSGSSYWVSTDDKGGGYWHTDPDDWDPIIRHDPTGTTYERQSFKHTMLFGPVTGALVGLGAGAVLGGIAGAITQCVLNRDKDPYQWPPPPQKVPSTPEKQRLARLADRAPLLGTAAGGALGLGAGMLMGSISQGKAQSLTQTLSEPVFQREQIGWIPYNRDTSSTRPFMESGGRIYYDNLPRDRFGEVPFSGREAVHRDVPTGEFTRRTMTEQSHKLSPLTGGLIGLGLGLAGGLLTGVASGVLLKAAAGEDPPPAGW